MGFITAPPVSSGLQCWDPQGLIFLTSKNVVTRGDGQEDKLES